MIPGMSTWFPNEELAVGFATLHLFGVTIELSGNDVKELGWKHGNSFQESRVFITRAFSPKEARKIVRSAVERWRLEKKLRMTENKKDTSVNIWISNVLTEQFLDHPEEPGLLSVIDIDYTTFAEDDKCDE